MPVRFPVTFEPAGVTVWVRDGETIQHAAQAAGIVIPAPCGGRGTCGKCAVRILDGEPDHPDEIEQEALRNAPTGVRLACRARVVGPLSVRPIVVRAVISRGNGIVASEPCVAGVDLGTTTVSAAIVGQESGLELGRASVPNQQQSFGMDIISRISAALEGQRDELRESAESSVIAALTAACGLAGACMQEVHRVSIAGNTAMAALLVGADVSTLATAPFEAPLGIDGSLSIPVLGASLADGASIDLVPYIGGFVGGDVTAGLTAAGMLSTDEDCLYVDVGTNVEVVVRRKGGLVFTSAAAGPAFEGYGISDGGVLSPGAVTGVRVDGSDVRLITYEDRPATWLTGPGLVSAIAQLHRVGHIDSDGLMRIEGPLYSRFGTDDAGVMRVSLGPENGAPHLTQLDVRAFQSAKAAVATAIWYAATSVRLKPRHLDRLYITGAFGAALDLADLVELGVVPEKLVERTSVVADAALLGASAIALDPTSSADIQRLRSTAQHIELATEPGFNGRFMEATRLEPYGLKKGPG